MSLKRAKQRLSDFNNALERLKEVLAEDPSKTSAIIDATIQRFEFTFELSWKLAQDILRYNGIQASNPRSAIKESFQQGYIKDGDGWIKMLDDRNTSSHIYDETQALKIYQSIKDTYLNILEDFKKAISPLVSV